MSTNINISVGDNKLLAQASLQQNASRQAQLEKEANKRLKSEAEINRVNALAAQGKDANGNPLTGTLTQAPQLERRPAANRLDGKDFFLLRPDAPIDLSAQPQQTPTVKTKFWPDSYWSPPLGVEGFLFEPTGGPNNKPAFRLNRDAVQYHYLYAVNPAGNNRDKYRSSIADATLEFFIYIGNTLPLVAAPDGSAAFSEHELNFRFGNLGRMELYVSTQSYLVGFPRRTTYYTYLGAFIRKDNTESDYIVANDIWSADPADIGSPEEAGYRIVEPWSLSPFQGQTWYHIALVKKERNVALYIDGNLYNQITVEFDFILQQPLPENPALTYNSAEIDITSASVGATLGSKVHGMRFTPKALYASNFTPPLNL